MTSYEWFPVISLLIYRGGGGSSSDEMRVRLKDER
jgi:hypothetical protein